MQVRILYLRSLIKGSFPLKIKLLGRGGGEEGEAGISWPFSNCIADCGGEVVNIWGGGGGGGGGKEEHAGCILYFSLPTQSFLSKRLN